MATNNYNKIFGVKRTIWSSESFYTQDDDVKEQYKRDIMEQYDSFIAASRDYHAPGSSDNATAYEQVKLIVARLESSVLLSEASKRRYHAVLDNNLEEICVDIARHDDRVTMGQLADLGVLTAENLERVGEAVGTLQDAAMTGYLLEMKRVRFSQRTFDFDL